MFFCCCMFLNYEFCWPIIHTWLFWSYSCSLISMSSSDDNHTLYRSAVYIFIKCRLMFDAGKMSFFDTWIFGKAVAALSSCQQGTSLQRIFSPHFQWTHLAQTCEAEATVPGLWAGGSSAAMSNPNGLLSQILCHYLNQGRTLNDILMRAAH